MAILVITVDLHCCRCKKKIEKVLECLKEEYCIQKIEYDDKAGKVIVRGQFDAEKLCKKIWCRACKVVKEIIIVPVWPPKPPTPDPPKPPTPDPPKPPPAPKPVCKPVPYPYPVPYPMYCQSSGWNCPPKQCHCCPTPAPPPPPRPPSPPKPKPCECSHHHCKPTPPPPCDCSTSNHRGCGCGCGCGGKPPNLLPPMWPPPPPFCPPFWCEETPPDACSTM